MKTGLAKSHPTTYYSSLLIYGRATFSHPCIFEEFKIFTNILQIFKTPQRLRTVTHTSSRRLIQSLREFSDIGKD